METNILLTGSLNGIENITIEEAMRLSPGDWSVISEHKKLTEDFIAKFHNFVDWTKVSEYQTLSESFIERYSDRVNWREISFYQNLSDNFVAKFYDKLDINRVIENSIGISEDFITNNIDKMTEYSWCKISYSRKLSEEFIREFQDRLDLDNILEHQALSDELRNELSHKLNKTKESYEEYEYDWDLYY